MKALAKFFSLVALFLSVQTAFAQENKWAQLFQNTFYSESVYEEGRCGENIKRLLRMARSQGLDLRQVQVIEIVNHGFTNFGLVGAKNSRGVNERDKESNWGHHVILKVGTDVLDYDFTMNPTPTELTKYFNSMFMTAEYRKNKEECLKRIGEYELTFYSGTNYLRYYDELVSLKANERESKRLKNFSWACQ